MEGKEQEQFNKDLERLSNYEGAEAPSGNKPPVGDLPTGETEFTPSPVWDYVKSRLPEAERETFKMPEDISAENEQKYIDEQLARVYKPAEEEIGNLHPLAKEIQQRAATDPNFDPQRWLKEQAGGLDLDNKTDDDWVKEDYLNKIGLKSDTNPNGITQEELDAEIEKMDMLDKKVKAKELREAKQRENQEKFSQGNFQQISQEELDKRVEAYKKQVDEFIETTFVDEAKREKPEEARKFAGFDVGEAEYQQFKESFKVMLTPDDKGIIPIRAKLEEVFNDDAKLVEFAKYIHFHDKIGAAVTEARNKGKLMALDLLPDHPRQQASGSRDTAGMSDEETINRLSSPEGAY